MYDNFANVEPVQIFCEYVFCVMHCELDMWNSSAKWFPIRSNEVVFSVLDRKITENRLLD